MPATAAVGVLVLLAGCGPRDTPEPRRPEESTPAASSPVQSLPSALVGQWKISGPGIAPDITVDLSDRTLTVFGKWCVLYGTWDARPGGPFLADLGLAGAGQCFEAGRGETTTRTAVSPMRAATGFVVDGERRLLLDATGARVAALTPGGRPMAPTTSADSVAEPPQVPADRLAALDAGRPPMPAGVRPGNPEEVIGVWSMPGNDPAEAPTVRFETGRRYDGTSICPTRRGRWDVADGALLMTGPVTGGLIQCRHDDPFLKARAVGTDGVHLVLLDADGGPIQRMNRVRQADRVTDAPP